MKKMAVWTPCRPPRATPAGSGVAFRHSKVVRKVGLSPGFPSTLKGEGAEAYTTRMFILCADCTGLCTRLLVLGFAWEDTKTGQKRGVK